VHSPIGCSRARPPRVTQTRPGRTFSARRRDSRDDATLTRRRAQRLSRDCSVGVKQLFGLRFRPGNIGVIGPQPANVPMRSGAGHHPIASNDVGKGSDALGDELGMFCVVGTGVDDSGDQHLVIRKFPTCPYFPFVLVSWVGTLDEQHGRPRFHDARKDRLQVGGNLGKHTDSAWVTPRPEATIAIDATPPLRNAQCTMQNAQRRMFNASQRTLTR
jgi:hypothetical protein